MEPGRNPWPCGYYVNRKAWYGDVSLRGVLLQKGYQIGCVPFLLIRQLFPGWATF
jgi:hypothetical protein